MSGGNRISPRRDDEAAILSESRGSIADLYETHAHDAVRLAYLLTQDVELARDLVQDAFVRAIGRFRHLREPGAFGGYLRRTVCNLAKNYFRRRALQRGVLRLDSKPPSVPASTPDIESRDEMWAILTRVPYRQRAALVLRYYEDLPDRQIAECLGCSLSAARSLLARGLRSLRREAEEDLFDEEVRAN